MKEREYDRIRSAQEPTGRQTHTSGVEHFAGRRLLRCVASDIEEPPPARQTHLQTSRTINGSRSPFLPTLADAAGSEQSAAPLAHLSGALRGSCQTICLQRKPWKARACGGEPGHGCAQQRDSILLIDADLRRPRCTSCGRTSPGLRSTFQNVELNAPAARPHSESDEVAAARISNLTYPWASAATTLRVGSNHRIEDCVERAHSMIVIDSRRFWRYDAVELPTPPMRFVGRAEHNATSRAAPGCVASAISFCAERVQYAPRRGTNYYTSGKEEAAGKERRQRKPGMIRFSCLSTGSGAFFSKRGCERAHFLATASYWRIYMPDL